MWGSSFSSIPSEEAAEQGDRQAVLGQSREPPGTWGLRASLEQRGGEFRAPGPATAWLPFLFSVHYCRLWIPRSPTSSQTGCLCRGRRHRD